MTGILQRSYKVHQSPKRSKKNELFSVIRTSLDGACRTDQEYHRFIYFESSFDQKIFEIQIT